VRKRGASPVERPLPGEEARRRPGRPAGASGDRTRERLVVAAVEVFARDGQAGASVRDIARRARIRVSTLYHYFPSKEALYREVQDRVDQQIRQSMMEVMAKGLDIRETTREAMGKLFDFFLANRAYARLAFRACLESPGGRYAEGPLAHRWLGFAEGALKPAEVSGLVKGVDLVPFMLSIDALLHWHVVNDANYVRLLGKGLSDPEVARRVREHLVLVVLRTLGLD